MRSEKGNRPRIAASSYLNTAPLVWSFLHGSRQGDVQLLMDAAPARCAQMLAHGEVEAALVPVIEYHRIPDITVVPGVCIGARRAVRSVVLATRCARLEDIRSIALDNSSRTSAALIQIIFREYLQRAPSTAPSAPNLRAMLDAHDAALIIGDPAMTFPRGEFRIYDLAGLWREYTGLGFVFAMWMARSEAAEVVSKIAFAGARDEGLAHAREIATRYERRLALPQAELLTYLQENICFELDEEMRAGLELFYRLAHKHGLITSLRSLKMLAPVLA